LRDFSTLSEGAKAAGGGAYSTNEIAFNIYNMGIDTITLGNGNNEVYGDLRDWNSASIGGHNFAGGAFAQSFYGFEVFSMAEEIISSPIENSLESIDGPTSAPLVANPPLILMERSCMSP